MKLERDLEGITGGKILALLVLVFIVFIIYVSGIISIGFPALGQDKYEEIVARTPTDVGIKVPINVRLTFNADADKSAQRANINVNMKHKHASADSVTGDVCPDAVVISALTFNTEVANTGDTSTIYTTNGNSFTASNVTYDSTVSSIDGINTGLAQNNYKVWTKDRTYQPPSSVGANSNDNSAIYVTMVAEHYRKGTSQVLASDTVRFLTYYRMPDYDEDESYTVDYTYNLYIPFNDYAVIEDIKLRIWGYADSCKIEWTTVEVVTHTFFDVTKWIPILKSLFGQNLKFVGSKDVNYATRIQYTWTDPWRIDHDNSNTWGSHSYLYKIR